MLRNRHLFLLREDLKENTELGKIANAGRPIIVNSSNYITTDLHLAQNFNRLGIGLENMEFYSVMQVAQNFNIPCGGIFVITNMCNENAHNDFLANHNEAMTKLIEYLQKRIPNLETFHS